MPGKGKRWCVLAIAGADSGGGAGLLADVRTIHAFGGFAAIAVTAVTAQNSCGVRAWRAVPAKLVREQVEAVFDDLPVRAVKVGLLPAGAIPAVAAALAGKGVPVVVDPVLGSTSGTRFSGPAARRSLVRRLFPLAALVTPNWPEAAALSGLAVRSEEQAEAAGRALLAGGCRAVLVKGGHGRGARVRDLLLDSGRPPRVFSAPRIYTGNTRGTGCVLSAAIACGLARGDTLAGATAAAREFLRTALKSGRGSGLSRGAGPSFPG